MLTSTNAGRIVRSRRAVIALVDRLTRSRRQIAQPRQSRFCSARSTTRPAYPHYRVFASISAPVPRHPAASGTSAPRSRSSSSLSLLPTPFCPPVASTATSATFTSSRHSTATARVSPALVCTHSFPFSAIRLSQLSGKFSGTILYTVSDIEVLQCL